jgi:hypothetical protein
MGVDRGMHHPRAAWFGALGVALGVAGLTGIALVLTGVVAAEQVSIVFAVVTVAALVPLRALFEWRERRARSALERLVGDQRAGGPAG